MLTICGCKITQSPYGGFYLIENLKRKTKRKSSFLVTALLRAWLGI